MVGVVFHPACQRHDPGLGHPERPERIVALLAALRAAEMASAVEWCEARPATREALERVHSARYLDGLERLARQGGGALDADTVMSPDSWDAAVAAAGVAVGAVERGIATGTAFGATRPPGHHALAAVDAAIDGWPPDLLLVSAGFDSLNGDPLGGFTLEPDDMAQWTTRLRERVAPAPVVGVLEGGYRLDLIAAGACAHVRALA